MNQANLSKRELRMRRSAKARAVIARSRRLRISVHRSGRHIYAQLIDPQHQVLVSASTVDKELAKLKATGTVAAAREVGELFARRLKQAKLDAGAGIAFDRSGFSYHGRVKALSEGIRAGGVAL